jgi:putative FmdB family regulatory protein
MPTYEFLCHACGKAFEWISSIADYERKQKEGLQCPTCASRDVARQLSSVQVKTSKKS